MRACPKPTITPPKPPNQQNPATATLRRAAPTSPAPKSPREDLTGVNAAERAADLPCSEEPSERHLACREGFLTGVNAAERAAAARCQVHTRRVMDRTHPTSLQHYHVLGRHLTDNTAIRVYHSSHSQPNHRGSFQERRGVGID